MEHPDILEVSQELEETLEADGADLFVSISGATLVMGDAALSKAREVAVLVSELKSFGLEERRIRLENVRVETK